MLLAAVIHPEGGHVISESHPESSPRIRVLFLTGVLGISSFYPPCSLPLHQHGGDVSATGDAEANTQGVTDLRQREGERQNPGGIWSPPPTDC